VHLSWQDAHALDTYYQQNKEEPATRKVSDYMHPPTSRSAHHREQIRRLQDSQKTLATTQINSSDHADFNHDRGSQASTPALCTTGAWQAFRSPREPAFPKQPHAYVLKDYLLRPVTHRVYDGRVDNCTIQANALYHSTAFTTTDRPLAKPSSTPTLEMLRLKKESTKAAPPKGRRNLNSNEFLGVPLVSS
jgi:hypothetical protein